MPFIDQNLMEGEEIVFRTRLHWLMLALPATLAGAALIFLIVAFAMLGRIATYIALGLLVIFGFILLARYVIYMSSEFGVTNRRVMIKVGFLTTHSTEILLSKVEAIQIDQNLLGRIFGFGTIVITGSGGTHEVFDLIAAPFEFRNRVQEQIAGGRGI